MENIFKVQDFKIKYESVQYLHEESKKEHSFLSKEMWSYYIELIRGFPPDIEKRKDSLSGVKSGELVNVEKISAEERNRYIEQLNCTPEQAHKAYQYLIRAIKSEKEVYLKCIDAELAKGDLSEYANKSIALYSFLRPERSLIPPPVNLTKLDFLKVFKEYVLNDNKEVLPDGIWVHVYLKCGCKI
jgi:hypothetical protein